MTRKDLLKTIITDSQQRAAPDLWERTLKIPHDSGKIVTLSGVRRSGKTYHLFQLMKGLRALGVPADHMLYMNFEDERLTLAGEEMGEILDAYAELFPGMNMAECYFFFDEIQEISGWEKFVSRLYASVSPHVFITGSNATLLSREIATGLRGRTITYEVYPLSFAEFAGILSPEVNQNSTTGKATMAALFSRFMHQGGFPELIRLEPEVQDKVLQEYFNVMVLRDIIDRYQVSNSTTLKYFCKRVVGASAGEFSVNKTYNELKSQGYQVGKDTLYAFQDYVEAVYLGRFISKYSHSVVKTEGSQKKAYVIDQGLGAALDYKLSLDEGRLLETTVALELLKQGKQIAYNQNGSECDFVVIEKGQVVGALQVALDVSDAGTLEREVRGLVGACRGYGLSTGSILTLDTSLDMVRDGVAVSVVPAWRYFGA